MRGPGTCAGVAAAATSISVVTLRILPRSGGSANTATARQALLFFDGNGGGSLCEVVRVCNGTRPPRRLFATRRALRLSRALGACGHISQLFPAWISLGLYLAVGCYDPLRSSHLWTRTCRVNEPLLSGGCVLWKPGAVRRTDFLPPSLPEGETGVRPLRLRRCVSVVDLQYPHVVFFGLLPCMIEVLVYVTLRILGCMCGRRFEVT